jgi:hypothetical protein
MLNETRLRKKPNKARNHRREAKLWHDSRENNPSLGCSICEDRQICGGLRINRATFDCLDNCCGMRDDCDSVCRNRPRQFAQRVREIEGFGLENVPRAEQLTAPNLPKVVPVLFHGKRRESRFCAPAVCLPLYSVIARQNGEQRYTSAADVAENFLFEPGVPVLLTGTANDRPLERWWSLGSRRIDEIHHLLDLGAQLVTTPNFSLFTDQPRWDDMHSMKRIAIVHEEFLRCGLPAALHLNARTERDWERWTDYIRIRTEISHVSFEFTTGAGWNNRIGWHADRLVDLAQSIRRPLHLVVRAPGREILPKLNSAFADTTVLETSAFQRAVHRQRAVAIGSGKVEWFASPTAPNAPLDELLTHNWAVMDRSFDTILKSAAFLPAAE